MFMAIAVIISKRDLAASLVRSCSIKVSLGKKDGPCFYTFYVITKFMPSRNVLKIDIPESLLPCVRSWA